MKISGYINIDPDYENDEDDYDEQIPYYCKKCNHNEDWPDCVIECRKWRAEL